MCCNVVVAHVRTGHPIPASWKLDHPTRKLDCREWRDTQIVNRALASRVSITKGQRTISGRRQEKSLSFSSSCRHATALFCATKARLCTRLAMAHLMFGAFIAAGFAHLGTKLAKRSCHFTAARHISCCKPADLRAIDVQGNTPCHHFYILLLQTGCGTIVTGCCACIACFDTRLELLAGHADSFKLEIESRFPI